DASTDARDWLITLRPGVTFHDGKPLTAQDAAASLARASHALDGLEDIRVVADHQLRLRLRAGNTGLPIALSDARLAILPEENPETALLSGNGTGRYRQIDATGLRFVADPSHYLSDNTGWFDRIDATHTAAKDVQTALRDGEVDLIDHADPMAMALLGRHPRLKVLATRSNQHLRIGVEGAESTVLVSALKRGLDRQLLVDHWLAGYGVAGADHPVPPSGHVPSAGYDPDHARHLLACAGVTHAMVSLSAELVSQPGTDRLLSFLAASARAIGLTLSPATESNRGAPELRLSLARGGPTADATLAAFPRAGLSRPDAFDGLLTAARIAPTSAERRMLLHDAQTMIADEATTHVPAFPDLVLAHSRRLIPAPSGPGPVTSARIAERWAFA
ncbi:MAG: hypothetical protein HKN02_09720, partial [Rhodobacteraceae bacterium]|nr:hypothetical protein [Paracoccaceae bacterium]